MINTDCVKVREKKIQECDQVYCQVSNHVEYQVWEQVWCKVCKKVWFKVYND